jgi:hypothetical protein
MGPPGAEPAAWHLRSGVATMPGRVWTKGFQLEGHCLKLNFGLHKSSMAGFVEVALRREAGPVTLA